MTAKRPTFRRLILLIARLYFISKTHIAREQILLPHVLVSNINVKEYNHLILLCDELKRYVSVLDVFERFLDVNVDEHGIVPGAGMPIKKVVVNLLESIKNTTQTQQQIVRINKPFPDEDGQASIFYLRLK